MERKRTGQKRSVGSKKVDARKSPTWSETTSPTATISTFHTMRSSSLEQRMPPTEKESSTLGKVEPESEHDSLSVMTPSQPLHDKLDELQQKWSEKRPSCEHPSSDESHYVFAAGGRILHRPSQPRAIDTPSPSTAAAAEQKVSARKKGLSIEIIGSPDEFPVRQEKQSVFDRLYQQAKSSTVSRRRRPSERDGRTYRSMPMPATPQSSVEGTISTLSSSESIFDRLYKNEKRNRVQTPRRVHHSDSMSASASLERRLSYQVPPVRRRNRVISSGKVASLIQQHESRKPERAVGSPRSESSGSPQKTRSFDEKSVTSAADSVFDRLYRGEKRKTPLLANSQSTLRPVRTKRTLAKKASSPDSTHLLPFDSVFERLYKGEKRKTPLLDKRKRSFDSRKSTDTSQTAEKVQRPPEIDVPHEPAHTFRRIEEATLLEEALRSDSDGESDESLLHSELSVLHIAEQSRNDAVDRQRLKQAPMGGAPSVASRDWGNEIESRTVRDALAQLKLQLFVRRIQRCARAYIARAPGKKKKSSTTTQRMSNGCRPEEQEDRAVVLLQSLWRAYHCRIMTMGSLLQSCELDCNVLSPSQQYSRILLLRIRMQSLSRAISDAGAASLAKMQVDEHSIRVEWSRQVIIHFCHCGLSRMESAVIALKCNIIKFSFLTCWPSQRLSTMVVKAGLLVSYRRESERLVNASASVIQSWARRMVLGNWRPSKNRGRVCSVQTTGLLCLFQYLTPTSLQQRSAITLQCAWRFHQSQVRAADAMLTSWRVACDVESIVPDSRILGERVGLFALMKAIGRVDCWWITENIIVGDHVVSVKWEREVGVHFTQRGVPKLESCTVGVACEANRTVFVERWGHRKFAILIVKAVLNRASGRDRSHLMDAAATLMQAWFRMKRLRLKYLCKIDACKTIQKSFRSLRPCTAERRAEWSQNGSRLVRGVEGLDLTKLECAVTLIQKYARCFLVTCRMQSRDRAARTVQRFLRHQRARHFKQSREEAALFIQASLRSLLRRSAERRQRSAKRMQAFLRSVATRNSFVELRRAAIVIQTWERRRRCIFLFLAMRDVNIRNRRVIAASKIQNMYRGARLRKQFATEVKNATSIQCAYRRHRVRSSFLTIYAGIVKIQAAHRGIMSRRLIFLWHTLVAWSRLALLVQKLWRRFRVRRDFVLRRSSSVVIQSSYRRYYVYRRVRDSKIHAQVVASVTLQKVWRGSKSRTKVALLRDRLISQRIEAAIVIQCCYRCFEFRGDFLTLRQAAIDIQTFERRRRSFLDYQRVLVGCLRLQALCRGAEARRVERTRKASAILVQALWRGSRNQKQFTVFRNSIVLLQSACRRRSTLNLVKQRTEAALLIQRSYRCCEVRGDFLTLRQAAIEIQTFERRRTSFMKYQKVLVGCLRLQALCRGAITRMLNVASITSAVLIQTVWRGSRKQRQFATFRKSVVILQSSYRRRKALTLFQIAVSRIVSLQALYRGFDVRRSCTKQLYAAVRVQAAWRGERDRHLVSVKRENHQKQRAIENGIVVLQDVFRARRQHRETLAVVIQRCYRQHLFCKTFNQAVVRIQAAERRRRSLSKYSRVLLGTVYLQAHQRGVMARHLARRTQSAYLAVILIQRCWRRHFLRQNFLMLRLFTVRIQTLERRRQSLTSYQYVVQGTIRLQSHLRGTIVRQMLSRRVKAAVAVQQWFRGCMLRLNFVTLKQFAVQIQAAERRRQSLSMFSRALHGTVCLQARCRGILMRRLLERAQTAAAAVLIQNCRRRHYLRLWFLSLRHAAVRIQTFERRRSCLSRYTCISVGVVRLQASCRGYQARQMLAKRAELDGKALVLIQSCWRRFSLQQKFLAATSMAVRLQAAERRRQSRSKYINVHAGIVCLQAQFRGLFIRQLLTELAAAVIIQSWFRTVVPRRKFLSYILAAVLIQAVRRRLKCQLRYNSVKRGMVLLQSSGRGLLARKQLKLHGVAAARIQAYWRAALISKHLSVLKANVVMLQCAFRRHRAQGEFHRLILGVVSLQAVQRRNMTRRRLNEQSRAAAIIQAAWVQHRYCSFNNKVSLGEDQSDSLSTLAEDRLEKASNESARALVHDPVHFASVLIQSRLRSYMAKRTLEIMQVSARLIQVKYFCWKMQITLLMVQSSVVLLQRSVRAQLLRSAARFALSHINASLRSPIIESFARVTTSIDPGVTFIWLAWTKAVDMAREAACIVIQSAVRRMLAKQYRDELRMDQPTFRQFLSRNATSAFNSIKIISASVSPNDQKRSDGQEQRVTSVTGAEIKSSKDVKLLEAKPDRSENAVVIQRMIRRQREQQEVRKRNVAACQIQKTFRRRSGMTLYARCRAGVVCLQSRFRGAQVRVEMASLAFAAVRLQQTWRMRRGSHRFAVISKATLVMQANYRRRSTHHSFQAQREAARVIQTMFRRWYQAERVRSDTLTKTRASILLQNKWRVFRERQRYQVTLNAALVIQAYCRMRAASRSFAMQREAVNVLQILFRAWHQGALVRSDISLKRLASIRLQQMWRMHQERKRFTARRKMAVLMQASHQMRSASRAFHNQKEAVLALQATYRGFHQRTVYIEQRRAAVQLQSMARQFLAQATLLRILASVVTIQRVCRGSAVRQRRACNANDLGKDNDILLGESAPDVMDEPDSTWKARPIDYSKALERMQESIVSQVDSTSESEVNHLILEGGTTIKLESAGICIGRLVSRITDARHRAVLAANYAAAKRKNVKAPSQDTDCIQVNTAGARDEEQLREQPQATRIEDARRAGEKVAADQVITKSSTNVLVSANEEPSAGNHVDLARQAQELLLEARRARTRFQKSRTQNRMRETQPPTSQTQQSMSSKEETQMFGESVQDDDLPSPIKAEEEWDWTRNWK